MGNLKTKRDVPGSFRDPSGFLFYRDGVIYRQIDIIYKENYEHLLSSGLYDNLLKAGLIVPHDEVDIEDIKTDKAYKVIRPNPIRFVSYPYEWCFSQLKDAALTTLEIQKKALAFGMSLKDSSAYNIQFKDGRPLFIDTLSFEKYKEGTPWVAYRQFCQHFLAPLALMSCTDIRLNQLLRIYTDGVPLDLSSALLPMRTYFSFPILIHIHIHSKYQRHFSDKFADNRKKGRMGRMALLGLIDGLESAVKKLTWRPRATEWLDYYGLTNYSPKAFDQKKDLVSKFLDTINPKMIWDLGANIGSFSRIAASKGIEVISFDIDPACVEKNYLQCLEDSQIKILPLLLDLTNPSAGIGWENQERMSIFERGPVDAVLALALIHHLAISNNLPFKKIANFFSKVCNSLIIEFAPKEDSQVQKLLSVRKDIFPNYTREAFECAFKEYFSIEQSRGLEDTKRLLYLMRKK